MDAVFIAKKLMSRRRETFQAATAPVAGTAAVSVAALAVSALAAYLSWSCNTAFKYDPLVKVVHALLAAVFGSLYIAGFVIFRLDVWHMVCSGAIKVK